MHTHKITSTVNVMVGFPTERFVDFLRTLLFLGRTRKWLYQVSNVTTTQIALGTEMSLHPERFGISYSPDLSWTSEETGDEVARRRRLHILHRFMSLMRVPHQGIGD